MGGLQAVWLFVRGFFPGRAALMVENLALRHQLAVLRRSVKPARPVLLTRMTFRQGQGLRGTISAEGWIQDPLAG